jgi:hypothetical protein
MLSGFKIKRADETIQPSHCAFILTIYLHTMTLRKQIMTLGFIYSSDVNTTHHQLTVQSHNDQLTYSSLNGNALGCSASFFSVNFRVCSDVATFRCKVTNGYYQHLTHVIDSSSFAQGGVIFKRTSRIFLWASVIVPSLGLLLSVTQHLTSFAYI